MNYYRTCDVRGRYPDEIDDELFRRLGRTIARQFVAGRSIIVGCDVRVSSPPLKGALIDGLLAGGAEVLDVGSAPTSVIYFGKRHLGIYAAAIVTASHNSPEDNGLKLLLGRYPATPAQVYSLVSATPEDGMTPAKGTYRKIEIVGPYLDYLASHWKRLFAERGSRVARFVLDPGNGAWGIMLTQLVEQLDICATSIHLEANGRFPGRGSDCAAPGSLRVLGCEVRSQKAAAGIAWDADGDRLAVCDEYGTVISTDHLVMLLLPRILAGRSQDKILVDVKMSRKLVSEIERYRAIPVVERSGHCFLESRMIDDDCLFGCEYSGHFFFRDCCGADDGMQAALLVMDFIRTSDQPLSRQVAHLPDIFITHDIRIPETQLGFAAVRSRVLDSFPSSRISCIDGIKVDLGTSSFLVRPSVSERKLSFRFEGDTANYLAATITRVEEVLPECRERLEAELSRFRSNETSLARE